LVPTVQSRATNAGPVPLERFIPHPDVRERFETTIRAPADLVMEVAGEFDMQSLPAVRIIFRLREKLTRATRSAPRRPQGILEETRSLGWGLLAEEPGRFVVCGAACQPWRANVEFSPVAPEEFAKYAQRDQVKIAWTLEAAEIGPGLTRFGQETRAVATDGEARVKFRRYWRWARFGIVAIRLLMLPAVRRTAERRWAAERSRR
jgi:hypothetical protein